MPAVDIAPGGFSGATMGRATMGRALRSKVLSIGYNFTLLLLFDHILSPAATVAGLVQAIYPR